MTDPTPEDIGIAGVILTYIGGPHPDCQVHPARLPDDPCAECEVLAGAQVIAKVRAQARREAQAEVERLRAGIEALADWHETKAEKADRYPGPGRDNHVAMSKAATVHRDASRRVRALLDGEEGS